MTLHYSVALHAGVPGVPPSECPDAAVLPAQLRGEDQPLCPRHDHTAFRANTTSTTNAKSDTDQARQMTTHIDHRTDRARVRHAASAPGSSQQVTRTGTRMTLTPRSAHGSRPIFHHASFTCPDRLIGASYTQALRSENLKGPANAR